MKSSQERSLLSTKPYRGTRDFYPELQAQRMALFSRWRNVLEKFCYEEYDAPLLEPLELYAAKSSEEIVQTQLYSFQDRGERQVALRPEMTPSLARMVAAKAKELSKPVRWFSIPKCMRYERPQRGRLREFDQLNVDVFGGIPLDEDIEILSTAIEIMQSLGAQGSDFQIKINDRSLMNSLLTFGAGLKEESVSDALGLIDKKDKMDASVFAEKWNTFLETHKSSQEPKNAEALLGLFNKSDFTPADAKDFLDEKGSLALAQLEKTLSLLKRLYPDFNVQLDLGIARGFDYYTGLVFEIFDTHPENNRALFGGGRYDNLVGSFIKDSYPGVGFGVSDVSLLNFCEVRKIDLVTKRRADVAVVRFDENDRESSAALAFELRKQGLKVSQPLSKQKFGKQIQAAEKLSAKCVVFRGQDELDKNTFMVKWLEQGTQEELPCTEEGYQSLSTKITKSD